MVSCPKNGPMMCSARGRKVDGRRRCRRTMHSPDRASQTLISQSQEPLAINLPSGDQERLVTGFLCPSSERRKLRDAMFQIRTQFSLEPEMGDQMILSILAGVSSDTATSSCFSTLQINSVRSDPIAIRLSMGDHDRQLILWIGKVNKRLPEVTSHIPSGFASLFPSGDHVKLRPANG